MANGCKRRKNVKKMSLLITVKQRQPAFAYFLLALDIRLFSGWARCRIFFIPLYQVWHLLQSDHLLRLQDPQISYLRVILLILNLNFKYSIRWSLYYLPYLICSISFTLNILTAFFIPIVVAPVFKNAAHHFDTFTIRYFVLDVGIYLLLVNR